MAAVMNIEKAGQTPSTVSALGHVDFVVRGTFYIFYWNQIFRFWCCPSVRPLAMLKTKGWPWWPRWPWWPWWPRLPVRIFGKIFFSKIFLATIYCKKNWENIILKNIFSENIFDENIFGKNIFFGKVFDFPSLLSTPNIQLPHPLTSHLKKRGGQTK